MVGGESVPDQQPQQMPLDQCCSHRIITITQLPCLPACLANLPKRKISQKAQTPLLSSFFRFNCKLQGGQAPLVSYDYYIDWVWAKTSGLGKAIWKCKQHSGRLARCYFWNCCNLWSQASAKVPRYVVVGDDFFKRSRRISFQNCEFIFNISLKQKRLQTWWGTDWWRGDHVARRSVVPYSFCQNGIGKLNTNISCVLFTYIKCEADLVYRYWF